MPAWVAGHARCRRDAGGTSPEGAGGRRRGHGGGGSASPARGPRDGPRTCTFPWREGHECGIGAAFTTGGRERATGGARGFFRPSSLRYRGSDRRDIGGARDAYERALPGPGGVWGRGGPADHEGLGCACAYAPGGTQGGTGAVPGALPVGQGGRRGRADGGYPGRHRRPAVRHGGGTGAVPGALPVGHGGRRGRADGGYPGRHRRPAVHGEGAGGRRRGHGGGGSASPARGPRDGPRTCTFPWREGHECGSGAAFTTGGRERATGSARSFFRPSSLRYRGRRTARVSPPQ